MATVELTKDNFEQVITGNNMVVIDFWAPWCAPCRSFAPTFEKASEQHDDVVFAKVNTEQEQEIAAAFRIRSIPTLMFFREQVILYSEAGALPPPALEQVLSKGKEIDMAEVHREVARQSEEERLQAGEGNAGGGNGQDGDEQAGGAQTGNGQAGGSRPS